MFNSKGSMTPCLSPLLPSEIITIHREHCGIICNRMVWVRGSLPLPTTLLICHHLQVREPRTLPRFAKRGWSMVPLAQMQTEVSCTHHAPPPLTCVLVWYTRVKGGCQPPSPLRRTRSFLTALGALHANKYATKVWSGLPSAANRGLQQ